MRKLYPIVYAVTLILFLTGCKKTEDKIPQKQEEKINFQLTPDENAGIFNLNVDSLDLTVSLVSAMPDSGIYLQIQAKRNLDDKILLKLDTNIKQTKFQSKIIGFDLKSEYDISISVSSIKNPINSSAKVLKVNRGRIMVNYLRPSYELFSRVKLWQNYPAGYGSVAKVDYDGDGLEDYVWFEGYDPSLTYTWPGPLFEKFNGTTFVKQPISFPGTKLYATKILVGDFNNDTYPDVFLASHIDEWAGCNCKPTPINPPHIIFNSPTGFNRVKSFTDIPGDWAPGCSGDLDKDGDLDVILFSHHQDVSPKSRALINNGSGEFTYSDYGISEINWADCAELIDMNNDGFLDLIVNDVVDENGYANRFRILWGNGGPFSEANSVRLPFPNSLWMISLAAEDLDNDGIREIITVSGSASEIWELTVLKTTNNRTFQDITSTVIKDYKKNPGDGVMNCPIQVQDLNGDGKMDIFTADRRLNLIWQKDNDGVYKRKGL